MPRSSRSRPSRFAFLLPVCLSALGGGAAAQNQPQRLIDINPTILPADVREHRVVLFGPHAYFPGFATRTGVELYRAATTHTSLQLLLDTYSGKGSGYPFALTPMGKKMYYLVDDGTHGFELWSTDGTNTLLVKDIYTGLASSVVPDDRTRETMGVLNNVLYFAAEDGKNGYGLWRSDGTTTGTTFVKTLGTWPARTGFEQWSIVNGFGLFLTRDGKTGDYGLWQTDGTAGGTKRLRSLIYRQNRPLRTPYKLHTVDKALFISGLDTLLYVQPASGFTTVTSLKTASGIIHSGFGPVADTLSQKGVFLFSGGTYLWRSDGTVKGTLPYFPRSGLGVLNSFEQRPAVAQNRMLFFGFDLKNGEEPWITDGTAGGTRLLKDIRPGPPHSTVKTRYNEQYRIVTDGTRFYFSASDGKNGLEVWETDGSLSGTRMIADVNPGSAGSMPRSMVGLPTGGVAFVADDQTGSKLWTYDPRTAKVRVAAANFHSYLGRTSASRVLGLTPHHQRVYFAANDGKTGSELWCSDGTTKGTFRLSDIHPGSGSSLRHHDLINGPDYGALVGVGVGPQLYFNAYDRPGKLAMFRTNGTSAGTVKVRDLDLIGGGGWPLRGHAIGETLLFHGYERGTGEGLYAMQPGSSTMVRVSATQPGRYYRLGNRLVFTDGFPPALKGVWVTDGTPQGTVPLARFTRPVVDPFLFTRIGRVGFFSMMHQGGVLWRTDGSVPGTTFLRVAAIRGMAAINDTLWTLEEVTAGTELKKGDGTTAGTTVVATGVPRNSQDLLVVGNRLFFVGYVGNDSELWTSDGTTAGTLRLAQFPGVGAALPRLTTMLPVGTRKLFFQVTAEKGIGAELWQSDGTVAGTKPVADIHRGPGGNNGEQLTLVNGKLFFLGNDGRHDSIDGDLFAMDAGAVSYWGGPGCAFDGHVPELTGTDPILGGKVDFELRAAPSKTAVFLLGVESGAPLLLPRGCRVYPAPARGFTIGVATNAAGRWALRNVSVPNVPSAQGLRIVVQVAVSSDSRMPFGADFSNSAVLVLGY